MNPETKPTEAALRAAEIMRVQGCIDKGDVNTWAEMIDATTGLPELLEALAFYARKPSEMPNALNIDLPGNMNDWNRIISQDAGETARIALAAHKRQ